MQRKIQGLHNKILHIFSLCF